MRQRRYYLRYLTDSEIHFLPGSDYRQVDLYVGGQEHACMHLIYARFIHMFLYDIGVVPVEEPFKKVIHQGMITHNGTKMGKRAGNAINPDDYDPNELRLYLMFLGHYFDGGDWSDKGIVGISRFLKRLTAWLCTESPDGEDLGVDALEDKIDEFARKFKFNRVVSTLMEFYNKNKGKVPSCESASKVARIVQVFAPGYEW